MVAYNFVKLIILTICGRATKIILPQNILNNNNLYFYHHITQTTTQHKHLQNFL